MGLLGGGSKEFYKGDQVDDHTSGWWWDDGNDHHGRFVWSDKPWTLPDEDALDSDPSGVCEMAITAAGGTCWSERHEGREIINGLVAFRNMDDAAFAGQWFWNVFDPARRVSPLPGGVSAGDFLDALDVELRSPAYQATQTAFSQFQATCGSGATLLSVCLDLRMAHTGATDPLPNEVVQARCAALRARLGAWTPSYHPGRAGFDEAVKQLVVATLAEVQSVPTCT